MAEIVFVAPHYDDVALSCGGTVATVARTATPLIATIFGGKPDPSALTPFAQQMHVDWGLSADEAVDQRRHEDQCAAKVLGASVRTYWLEHTDAIYRDVRYDSDEALFGVVLDSDQLVDQIVSELAETGGDEFYVPLGIGQHVDHQIVCRAGLELAKRGATVYGYADLPYALDDGALCRRMDEVQVQPAHAVELDAEAERRRWEAVRCYASQWGVIFRNTHDPRQAFEEFGRRAGNGTYMDRFWSLSALR